MRAGLFIRQGKLIERDVSMFPLYQEADEEFLTFIGQFYSKQPLPSEGDFSSDSVDQSMIERTAGNKRSPAEKRPEKELLMLAHKNAKIALKEKFSLIERDEERSIGAVQKLGEALNIYTPHRIEAFDNSNIQGTNPVSAMIVFIDGKPYKRNTANIKSKLLQGRMITVL